MDKNYIVNRRMVMMWIILVDLNDGDDVDKSDYLNDCT